MSCGYKDTDTIYTAPNPLWSLAISKNDKMIAIGDFTNDGIVRIFSINDKYDDGDAFNFKLEKEAKLHSGTVFGLAFSDDNNYLLSCSGDKTIVLSDAKSLQKIKTFNGNIGYVWSVVFISENEIVSCSNDKKIIVWDINSGNQIASVDTGYPCRSLALSPNKEMMVVGQLYGNIIAYESTITIVNKNNNNNNDNDNNTLSKITDILPKKHSEAIYTLCFTPNGKMLISFSGDRKINVYTVLPNKSFNHIRTLIGHTSYIYGGAISPDGEIIASASVDDTIKLWDVNTDVCIKTITSHDGTVAQVAFSHSGTFLASVGFNKTLRIAINEDFLKFRYEKVFVILFLAKSNVFVPFHIQQGYLQFVNHVKFKFN